MVRLGPLIGLGRAWRAAPGRWVSPVLTGPTCLDQGGARRAAEHHGGLPWFCSRPAAWRLAVVAFAVNQFGWPRKLSSRCRSRKIRLNPVFPRDKSTLTSVLYRRRWTRITQVAQESLPISDFSPQCWRRKSMNPLLRQANLSFCVVLEKESPLRSPGEPRPPPMAGRCATCLIPRPGRNRRCSTLYLPVDDGSWTTPLVVWIHGGGWSAGGPAACCPDFYSRSRYYGYRRGHRAARLHDVQPPP